MVIQHNVPALNSHRVLGLNNKRTSGNLEKLSSGYRINRAGDDAAGLAISEKMRGQIRGLAMAEQNVANGVSLIQTAEGGLNEIHAILQRMRELAVQSSNGTYDSSVDRQNLELEFQAIKDEIDRISNSTHYNGIKLLDGTLGSSKIEGTVSNAAPADATIEVIQVSDMGEFGILGGATIYFKDGAAAGSKWPNADLTITITNNQDGTFSVGDVEGYYNRGTIKAGDDFLLLYSSSNDDDYIKINLTGDAVDVMGRFDQIGINIAENGVVRQSVNTQASTFIETTKTAYTQNSALNAVGLKNTIVSMRWSIDPPVMQPGFYSLTFTRLEDGNYLATMGSLTARFTEEEIRGNQMLYGQNGDILPGLVVGEFRLEVENADAFLAFEKIEIGKINYFQYNYIDKGATAHFKADIGDVTVGAGNGLVFQVGANGGDDQRVKLFVGSMDTHSLGLKRGDLLSDGSVARSFQYLADASIASITLANKAIDIITGATNQVSAQRADLGALQNRLEHSSNNLGVTKENLTAAESTIRDVDMAKEMMEFTKNNILVQAAQAMLAQSNQLPQGLLQLLR